MRIRLDDVAFLLIVCLVASLVQQLSDCGQQKFVGVLDLSRHTQCEKLVTDPDPKPLK